MNELIDWHYHLSGRNVKEDIQNLQKYTQSMQEVYVMASYFPKNGSGLSNYNLYYHLKEMKKVKLYLSLDFEHYFFQGYNEMVNIIKESPEKIIGIKIYTGYQNIQYDEKFEMVLDLARQNDLYIMFHTGYLKGNQEVFCPMQLSNVIGKNTDIKFILAHLGNPHIEETIELLNKHEHLYTDISGLVDKQIEIQQTVKNVKKLADRVDHKKVLFGTDYPMQDYKTTKIFADVLKS